MKRASFVDKEKQVLVTVAEKIGSTLGQVAALGQVAKKATRASVKPVRRRLKRTVRTKSASKTARVSAVAHEARRVWRGAESRSVWIYRQIRLPPIIADAYGQRSTNPASNFSRPKSKLMCRSMRGAGGSR